MAYTTEQMLTEIKKYLPEKYVYFEDVLAGIAAQMATAHSVGIEAMDDTTITNAAGVWLDLVAHNYGLDRASGEDDTTLKYRIRNVEDALTKEAIENAVNAILATYSETCEVIEYFSDSMRFIGRAYIGETRLRGGKGFTVRVPLIGSSYTHAVYGIIVSEVSRIKAAGVPWKLLIDPDM